MRDRSPHPFGPTTRAPRQRGVSILETVFALGLALTIAMTTLAGAGEWRARTRIAGAARLVVMQVRFARALAVRDGTHVALVFTADRAAEPIFRLHRDGNGNGVRLAEAESGVDPPLGDRIRLGEYLPGAAFRLPTSLPPIDGGPWLEAGSDAVRLAGTGRVLSCGPTGGLTGGTLYVSGRPGETFAIRLLGGTGRLRLFEYSPASVDWVER